MTQDELAEIVDRWLQTGERYQLTAGELCNLYMYGARDFRGANLCAANLYGADLYGADLRDADLRGANLCRADLRGARGVAAAGPVGEESRMIYGHIFQGEIRIQAGCRNMPVEEMKTAVQEKYLNPARPHLAKYWPGYEAALVFIAAQLGYQLSEMKEEASEESSALWS